MAPTSPGLAPPPQSPGALAPAPFGRSQRRRRRAITISTVFSYQSVEPVICQDNEMYRLRLRYEAGGDGDGRTAFTILCG